MQSNSGSAQATPAPRSRNRREIGRRASDGRAVCGLVDDCESWAIREPDILDAEQKSNCREIQLKGGIA
jgi:hypothetical protein